MLGTSGERKFLWRKYHNKLGPIFPLGNAIRFTTFHDVEAVVNGLQTRGSFVGGQPQIIPSHFSKDVLIFHSGEKHQQLRASLSNVIQVLDNNLDDVMNKHLEWLFKNYQVRDDSRRETIAATMSMILFESVFI